MRYVPTKCLQVGKVVGIEYEVYESSVRKVKDLV